MEQALLSVLEQVILFFTLVGYFARFCAAFFISLFILAMVFFHYDSFRLRRKRRKEVLVLAEYVFEDKEAAKRWLYCRPIALGGKRPIDMLDSEWETKEVTTLLHRIEYGIVS
jgi:hypothetical protein